MHGVQQARGVCLPAGTHARFAACTFTLPEPLRLEALTELLLEALTERLSESLPAGNAAKMR